MINSIDLTLSQSKKGLGSTHPIISKIIIELMIDNSEVSFFGAFLSQMTFTRDDKLETMGVRTTPHGFELIYSGLFLEERSLPELRYILIHECFHCINNHHPRSIGHDPKIINIALDMVVNYMSDYYSKVYDFIDSPEDRIRLPDDYVGNPIYENVYDWLKKKSDNHNDDTRNQNSEYLNSVLDSIKSDSIEIVTLSDGSEGVKTNIDIHIPDTVLEDEREFIRDKAMSIVQCKNPGNLPGNVISLIGIEKRKENPLRKIKKSASTLSGSSKKRTFKKLNRRGRVGIKGFKREGYFVNILVDVSGSMNGMLEKSIGIILNTDIACNIIKCDTIVQSHDYIESTKDLKEFSYTGGGGTTLQPAIDYILSKPDLKKTGTLIITDGWTDNLNLSGLNHVIIATVDKPCPIDKPSKKLEQFKLIGF